MSADQYRLKAVPFVASPRHCAAKDPVKLDLAMVTFMGSLRKKTPVRTLSRGESTRRSRDNSVSRSKLRVPDRNVRSSYYSPRKSIAGESRSSCSTPTQEISGSLRGNLSQRTCEARGSMTRRSLLKPNSSKPLFDVAKQQPAKSLLPLSPSEAISNYRSDFTPFELTEVLSYEIVYFIGKLRAKSRDGHFENEKGDYLPRIGDHIAFRYEILSLLGKGTFGIVVKCKDHKCGETVAVKLLKNRQLYHQQGVSEICILQKLREKDTEGVAPVVLMKGSFLFRKHLCISFEFLNSTITDHIKALKLHSVPNSMLKTFAVQLLKALAFVKKAHIIHCDLKPDNILMTEHGNLKIIDFGSACFENAKGQMYIQSRHYRAPEVILETGYAASIDMWSLGCILSGLAKGVTIFPGDSEKQQLGLIMEMLGPPPKSQYVQSPKKGLFFDQTGAPKPVQTTKGRALYPGSISLSLLLAGREPNFVDFIKKCLEWNPNTRMTPEQGLLHPWITSEDSKGRPSSVTPSAGHLHFRKNSTNM